MTCTSTSAPSAHPSHTPIVSRRSILAGIPLLAAVAAGAAPALAQSAPDATFVRLVDACHKAHECEATFNRDVFTPAHNAWEAAVAAVPHYTTKRSFAIASGDIRNMSTARSVDARVAEDYLRNPYLSAGDDFAACVAELSEALEKRNAQVRTLKAQYRIAELEAEHDRLWTAWMEAVDAVQEHPVQSVGDLLTKLEHLAEDDDRAPSASAMIKDLRRIASHGEA